MNVLSLFSGIGGLDLGLERAGMTVVGQVELDPWCRKVLAKHWPEVPRHDDVRTAAEWWGDRRAPDIVAGGFPCQPVSLAGKGLAQADSRWLWPAFAGIIRELRPRYVLVENVPGLLGRGMGDVLGDLASIGYDAEWDCVPAAFVGAPHIRNRVWIVAYPAAVHRGPQQRRQPDRVLPEVLADAHVGRQRPLVGAVPAGERDAAWRGATLADAERDGLQGAEHAVTRQGTPAVGRRPADPDSADMADTEGQRRELRAAEGERPGRPASGHAALADAESDGCAPHVFGGPAYRRTPDRTWCAEPDVGRVAHGIPRRVDRLRGLGNAVVPQVAEHVGRLIMTAAAA